MRVTCHQRIVYKTRVIQRIVHDKGIFLGDCMRAERNFAQGAIAIEAGATVKPLFLPIDQCHQRDRYVEQRCGQQGDLVELPLRRATRQRTVGHEFQTFQLVAGDRVHAKTL